MEFWFRRKYHLSPRDPLFLDLTVEEMLTDYWAHHYYDNPKAAEQEFEDPDFDLDAELQKINEEAEQQSADDPDDWETLTT